MLAHPRQDGVKSYSSSLSTDIHSALAAFTLVLRCCAAAQRACFLSTVLSK